MIKTYFSHTNVSRLLHFFNRLLIRYKYSAFRLQSVFLLSVIPKPLSSSDISTGLEM